MKLRVNLTIEDYYSYVGSDPYYYSKKERVKASLPDEFLKRLYNLKFKRIKCTGWEKYYRVHFSIRMTEEELLSIIDRYKNYCHKPEDVTYKVIKKGRNER